MCLCGGSAGVLRPLYGQSSREAERRSLRPSTARVVRPVPRTAESRSTSRLVRTARGKSDTGAALVKIFGGLAPHHFGGNNGYAKLL